MPRPNAVGLLHAGDAARRLADHGRGRRATRCRPAARSRSTATASRPAVTAALEAHPLVTIERERGRRPAAGGLGPASSSPPARSPRRRSPRRSARLTGEDALAFFDAIAPIVHRETIDMDIAWFQSRYDKAGPGGTRRRLHQLPDGPASSTRPSSTRCSPATRPSSRSGKRRRPISTAACRSR